MGRAVENWSTLMQPPGTVGLNVLPFVFGVWLPGNSWKIKIAILCGKSVPLSPIIQDFVERSLMWAWLLHNVNEVSFHFTQGAASYFA